MINVHGDYSGTINAITHTAPHHADEVFATAMLAILFPVELFRTRDQSIIDSTDAIVYDVGGELNPEKRRFDHHQRDFVENRPDGIKYSSAGLIWREYGVEIVKKLGESKAVDDEMVAEVVARVDDALVRGIDARDNGQGEKSDSMSVSSVISTFNALWDEDENYDECFVKACEMAGMILEREIKIAISSVLGRRLVKDQIKATESAVLVMDEFIGGWLEEVVNSDNLRATDLLYAVFPAINGNWNVQAIPPSVEEMTAQRKPFPEGWRGLRDEELVRASGVETAIFCHAAGFFAVAKTKEDAISLAEKAINS